MDIRLADGDSRRVGAASRLRPALLFDGWGEAAGGAAVCLSVACAGPPAGCGAACLSVLCCAATPRMLAKAMLSTHSRETWRIESAFMFGVPTRRRPPPPYINLANLPGQSTIWQGYDLTCGAHPAGAEPAFPDLKSGVPRRQYAALNYPILA